ncbi:MAG: thrombospondin type 3 repeat family protein, partial [Gammaproteobacteria bacterium]
MCNVFAVADLRIGHLAWYTVIAVTLAGCGGSDTAALVVNGTPPTSVQAGAKYQYIPLVSNPAGRPLTFDITSKPGWATFVPSSGELFGTPGNSDVGTSAEIEIGVSDGTTRAIIGPFRITVNPPATPPPVAPPTIAGTPAATVTAGQPYSFQPMVTNPGGSTLSFTIVNRPAWGTFSTATGALSGTPTTTNEGTFANILISVSDGHTTASLPAFSIQVQAPANNAPTISGTPAPTVVAGNQYAFTPAAADPDGHALTFSILNAPSWASFSASTGQLSGSPPTADVGVFSNIVITASDGTLTASLPAFSIQVLAAANDTPTISGIPPTSVVAGSNYSFKPSATDPAGKVLTFSIQAMPPWATFSASTGALTGTPTSANIGTFAGIVIAVSDGTSTAALPAFSIQVQSPPDHAPVIGGTPSTNVVAGASYSFTPTASDPDGDTLTFSIANQPSWATFSSRTGQLSGTPAKTNIGTFSNIVISVSDGTLTAALPAFSIQVQPPPDHAPVIGGTPSTNLVAGASYSFTPTASDPDGDALTFSVANRPSWASFSNTTGQLSGTATTGNVGIFSGIVISVSDGTLTSSLPAFAIAVSAPANPPPTISGTPATSANAGTAYSFTPTAADPNGNPLTFSIQNPPSWASFNTQSGNLSGTPGSGDAGTYSNIIISVSDGTSTASLAAFSIIVTQVANGSATVSWSAP